MIERDKNAEADPIARMEELERLNSQLLAEKEQEIGLDFAWSGNLGHWYFDLVGNVVTFNPLKAAALGYRMEELPARVPYQFFTDRLHPEDHKKAMDAMYDIIYGRKKTYEVEYRIRHKDGSYRWFYDRGAITRRDPEGRPALVAGIVFDITLKKETEESLRRAKEDLESANAELARHRDRLEELVFARTRELAEARDEALGASRAKSAFLGAMSHEMRTPLNHITGMAYLLGRGAADEKQRERIAAIDAASRRLLALISDVLDYSRLEASAISLTEIEFGLSGLLDRALGEQRAAAAAKGLELALELDPDLPENLVGDPVQLGKILGALLDNAVKFSERGRVILRARKLDSGAADLGLRLEVEDQGIGIAPERQDGLFSLFSQGDEGLTRRYGGTGLGLAFARRLVALMAGEISFTSEPGRGSLFRVDLRLRQALPAALGAGARSEGEAAAAAAREEETARQAAPIARYLAGLLEDGDPRAWKLYVLSGRRLEPLLKSARADFEEACESFDYARALAILRAATAT